MAANTCPCFNTLREKKKGGAGTMRVTTESIFITQRHHFQIYIGTDLFNLVYDTGIYRFS